MNLYTQKVAWEYESPSRTLFLKLDWLGSEAKPHFLCCYEFYTHGQPRPEIKTLFLLSGHHNTECVQIVARLGRALVLEHADKGLAAVMARVQALARAWNDPDPTVTAWEDIGAYTILGQVNGLEFDAMRKHRA